MDKKFDLKRDKKKLIWVGIIVFFFIVLAILVNTGIIKPSVSGVYNSPAMKLSIELQDGGKVFVTPMTGENNRVYCAREGSWKSISDNQISIQTETNPSCPEMDDMNGMWQISKCKNFDGSSNLCLSKDSYYLIKK